MAECVVALTMPDAFYWLLKDIAQHAFFVGFSSVLMAEGSKATREYIATRSNVGKCVWSMAAGPGTFSKVSCDAFQGSGCARSFKNKAPVFTDMLTMANQCHLLRCCTVEKSLL